MIFDINWDCLLAILDLHEKDFGCFTSQKSGDFRLRVGSIAAAVFMVLWIIASTVVSAVFTVRYMGIVEDGMGTRGRLGWKKTPTFPWCQEDQAWYLLEGSARTAAAEAQSIMEAATQVGEMWMWRESWQRDVLRTILFIQNRSELARSRDTCVNPVLGSKLLSLQVKSALISAIDYGLIKTSYDYAAIESTLVPTMALLLDRINVTIPWSPDMQKKHAAKKTCHGPRRSKHPSKSWTEETLCAFLRYGLHWPHCGSQD